MTGRETHDAWAQEVPSEIAFWRHWISTRGDRWPQDFEVRFDPEAVFDGRFADRAARLDGPVVRLLDVGAGPLTSVGKRLAGKTLEVEACDPLAPDYDALLDELGLEPPVRTVACDGERLLDRYAPESFDVTHARNAIDHAYDPFAVVVGMLAITRPGGFVALGHETNEAVREGHVGLHQWNFDRDAAGSFVIWHARGVVDVSARLASLATVEVILEQGGAWADVIITRRPETAGMSPEAIAEAAGVHGGFDRRLLCVLCMDGGADAGTREAAREAILDSVEHREAVAVRFADDHADVEALAPAIVEEALFVALLEPGDALPPCFGARAAAVGELALDRSAVACALSGGAAPARFGGRLVRAHALAADARRTAPAPVRAGVAPAATSSRARALVVLGFHRSGTSMTTRLLHLLGADVGPEEDLFPADAEDNPRGYWEARRLIELNDGLLAALGGDAIHPPERPEGWHLDPALDGLRAGAAEWLDRAFGAAPVWALKDPRLCLTLPFWQGLLAERTDEVRYVICLRSPVETAASLSRRPYDPPVPASTWGDQWLEHVAAAVAATQGAPRLLVAYDDLLRDGHGEAARLADFAGLPSPVGERRTALEAAIEPGLRHHAQSLVAAAGDRSVSAAARGAHLCLLAAARARRSGDPTQLADALEAMVVEHARPTAAAGPPQLRDALVDALGELQRTDRSVDLLREQADAHRRQATVLQARLADAG